MKLCVGRLAREEGAFFLEDNDREICVLLLFVVCNPCLCGGEGGWLWDQGLAVHLLFGEFDK